MGKAYRRSPFFKAIDSSDLEEVKKHIENGIDVNKVYGEYDHPLYRASSVKRTDVKGKKDNRLEIIKLLLKHGAKLNSTNYDGSYALHGAAINGNKDIVKFLLKIGSNVNEYDESGITALHSAAYHGMYEILELLIENGADFDVKPGDSEMTPLEYMSTSGQYIPPVHVLKTIEVFINNGIDIDSRGMGGETPLEIASSYGNEYIVLYLLEKGAIPTSIFPVASVEPDIFDLSHDGPSSYVLLQIARYLIMYGADVNEKSSNGISPIQMASSRGNISMVRELLKYGADVPVIEESWSDDIKKMISSVNDDVILEWFKEDFKKETLGNTQCRIFLNDCDNSLSKSFKKIGLMSEELSTMFSEMTITNNETKERLHMIKNELEGKMAILQKAIEDGKIDKSRLLQEIDILSDEIIMLKRFTIGNKNSE